MNYLELRQSLKNGIGVPVRTGTIAATQSKVEGQDFVVNFGIQKAVVELHTLFAFNFFGKPIEWVLYRMGLTEEDAAEAKAVQDLYLNKMLPITVHAIPEGASSPMGVPFVVVETHSDFGWVAEFCTNYIYRNIWAAVVAATSAATYRDVMEVMAFETHSDRNEIAGLVRDMSSLDMSSPQTSAYTGAAHLTCFNSTTNHEGLQTVSLNYDKDASDVYFVDDVNQVNVTPDSAFEVVARLLEEDSRTEVVIDGSHPDTIRALCGYSSMEHHGNDDARFSSIPEDRFKELSQEEIDGLLDIVWRAVGGEKTDKDYKVIDKTKIRFVVSNCTHEVQRILLAAMHEQRFSSCNLIYGVGANVYNRVDPSVFGLQTYTGDDLDGIKMPAKGKNAVEAVEVESLEDLANNDLLRVVYAEGEMKIIEKLDDIRSRISDSYDKMFAAYFERLQKEKEAEESQGEKYSI